MATTTKTATSYLKVLLGVCLVVVLIHTLSLLQRGHVLLQEQTRAFAAAHKNDFLQVEGGFSSGYRAGDDTSSKSSNTGRDEIIKVTTRRNSDPTTTTAQTNTNTNTINNINVSSAVLQNVKILVAIASFDFRQIPHLEETLDGYHELCVVGARVVDVKVHTTVVYPVAWLDLWQTRFNCPHFTVTFVVVNQSIRLHLVDLHRALFYDELNNYDLFIYSEDDIRVTPTTVATYWTETQRLQHVLLPHNNYTLYNIGIVRYEYNFPAVVMDDKTRHATENVTRVYWEHSRPIAMGQAVIPNAVQGLDDLNHHHHHHHPLASDAYVHMKNHHQGMFLATRAHLQTWKELPHCQFDQVKHRPGYPNNPQQPLLGTQRVWMSSYQLYERPYCNIQQVLPVSKFGALTVHHVPNKNYRRIKGGKTKLLLSSSLGNNDSTTSVVVDQGSPGLITALQLHLALRRAWPATPHLPYRGTIRIEDRVTHDRSPVLEERFQAFAAYVARGGVMSDQDMQRTNLVEWEERLAKLNS